MKKVVRGKELKEKMNEAIELLCGTVKQTLGPMGSNVIIDHSNFNPFITNDGVTIAKNIDSDDETVAAIIEIAKEASIKTDENVGDGTTTTLVLLGSLINLSQEYIEKGVNPLVLKRILMTELDAIIKKLEKLKYEATLDNLKDIAKVSSGDKDIGELVGKILQNVDEKGSITIKEKKNNILDVNYVKGYSCPITHPSEYYFQNKNSINFLESYILIVNDLLDDVESISGILNEAMNSDKALVIVAKDFDDYFVNEIVTLNLEGRVNCFMIKIAEYGLRERIIQKDIEIITGAHIVENKANITGDNVGIIKNLYLDKEVLKMGYEDKNNLDDYIIHIEAELAKMENDFDREFYQRRRAMFTKGMAEISIGAPTKTECHEKRMRLEDAICSTYAAKQGIVLGGGVALLQISESLGGNYASDIWKEALKKPFEQIMINAALNGEEIKSKIEREDYKVIYNVHTGKYETRDDTNIVDAFLVVRNSLINAGSIASMLLTTTSLVINEYNNNLNKVDDYIEL